MIFAAISSPAYTTPTQTVHPERAAQIEAINNAGASWKAAAHPRFANEAPGASKTLMGVKGNWEVDIKEAVRMGEIEEFKPANANAAIPTEFDSAKNWPACAKSIDNIRDQSNCGCCWAFGGAEAASDRMCIASKASLLLPLSDNDVCFNSNFDGCDGGQITTPWSYIKRSGVVTGGNYNDTGAFGGGYCSKFPLPHCHHHGPQRNDPYPAENAPGCPHASSPRGPTKCDADASSAHSKFKSDKYTFKGQTQSASGVTGVQQMLMEGGPVETAFTVYSDFENYASGVYDHTTGSFLGGHAVRIVGWGVDSGKSYWKVANSWNPYWGEKGYFRIAFGSCGIDNQVIGSSASATWGKK